MPVVEDDESRNITYNILRSKGLCRKRPKKQRNSRINLKEKYKKA